MGFSNVYDCSKNLSAQKYPSDSNQNSKMSGFASPRPPGYKASLALSEFRNNQCSNVTFQSGSKDDIAAFRRYCRRKYVPKVLWTYSITYTV